MDKKALQFIETGIGCHAFVFLDRLGILSLMKKKKYFSIRNSQNYSKKFPELIVTAFRCLENVNVVELKKSRYYLTALGEALLSRRGLNTMLFEGYGNLMSQQIEVAKGNIHSTWNLLNGEVIARSSIQFGEENVDPLIMREIKKLDIIQRVCDLGCGSGKRLIEICRTLKIKGLGIELDDEALALADKNIKKSDNILIEKGDLATLKGKRIDIDLVMQFFVMHDIVPNKNAVKLLNQFIKIFPNMKYFFYVDVVSRSRLKTYMPGFEYVHGLQGFLPRNYEDTLKMFSKCNYVIYKEISIKKMPNTYLWILTPKISNEIKSKKNKNK